MKKHILLFLFIFYTFCSLYSNELSVTSLPLIDQLPSNSVQRVFQDKEGFMWLGTRDGICRYDGYRILVFRSNLNNPDLLTNNEITGITEDDAGFLWIGTKKGMNLLNKKTYEISHFENPELYNQEIKCITSTSDGSIWVGTSKQVFRYNSNRILIKKYDSSLPIGGVNSISEDNDGTIWVTVWESGLHKYDAEIDKFVHLPRIGSKNNPFKVFQDNKKQLWVCTWGDGVYLFNPSEENQAMYTPIIITNNERTIPEKDFYSITQDEHQGYIWLMSISGIYAMEYSANNKIQDVNVSHLFKASNNIFSEIVKDNIGNLWIGTFSEGVLNINFNKPVISNYSMPSIKTRTGITPSITSILQDDEGDIWINQNRWGLGIFNPESNTVKFYNEFAATKDIPELNNVSCMFRSRTKPDEIWIGSSSRSMIYLLKKKNGDIILVDKIDLRKINPNSGTPHLFFEDRKNNIWIVTSTGLIIMPYNKKENIEFSLGAITGITEDTKGTIWLSSENFGVYQIPMTGVLNIDKSKIKNYSQKNDNLISNNVGTICADINGKVWIGTKEGNIISYDIVTQEFTDISESFKMIGEGILNIISDDFGHIWVSTNKRIIEYNPINGASKSYSHTDGMLVNSFLINSYFKNDSGKILFGGNKGISVFTPSEKLSEQPKQIKTYITDVKINNKSVFDDNNNCRFDIAGQKLKFFPKDKNIEIDFSSLDYTFPGKIQYAYKMDGIDDNWIYAEKNRQFAIYNELKKGFHTFHIKATDENGLWTSEVTKLEIYKRPSFYETLWAYCIYICLIFVGFYIAFKTIKNRIKLRNELRIAQIEKEKSEELTQSKLRYFTNISHDFLTPLTIISCLIDDAEMTYKGKITQFDTMRSNVNRLKRLLQQVLDFRKVESGNMKLKISCGDVVTFIKDICDTHFIPLVKKKNIQLHFESAPNHIQAFFDADKVDKIIFNLLSNAYKYTSENGEIKILLEKQLKQGLEYLTVVIADTGVGISQDELKNIFVRFYNNKGNKASDSNGIGLSLTKDLLDLHHGTISVESQVGVGTTFTVEIPIDRDCYNDMEAVGVSEITILDDNKNLAKQDEQGNVEELTAPKEIGNENQEKINVLLIEDNEELLALIQNILIKHYKVFTARNGLEGLNIVKENNIDIVVSDVMMPEMDGLELCRQLKKDLETSHIPIILLTAKNSADDRIDCYNAGANAYISKPFELKVLEARISNFLLNKKDKQQEFKSNVEINISTLDYPSFDEQFLNNAIKIIESQLSESDLDVNVFAERLNMSKSSLYRKIKTMTGLSPNEFIRNIRLKHACQMLKSQTIPISEVAYAVGFSDPKYFTLCFKNEFNMTPREYQKSL